MARVPEQPTAWGATREMALLAGPSGRRPSSASCSAGPGAGAGQPASSSPPPPFATLNFWKAQPPARLRAPLGYAGATVQQREEDEDTVQGYVTVCVLAGCPT